MIKKRSKNEIPHFQIRNESIFLTDQNYRIKYYEVINGITEESSKYFVLQRRQFLFWKDSKSPSFTTDNQDDAQDYFLFFGSSNEKKAIYAFYKLLKNNNINTPLKKLDAKIVFDFIEYSFGTKVSNIEKTTIIEELNKREV